MNINILLITFLTFVWPSSKNYTKLAVAYSAEEGVVGEFDQEGNLWILKWKPEPSKIKGMISDVKALYLSVLGNNGKILVGERRIWTTDYGFKNGLWTRLKWAYVLPDKKKGALIIGIPEGLGSVGSTFCRYDLESNFLSNTDTIKGAIFHPEIRYYFFDSAGNLYFDGYGFGKIIILSNGLKVEYPLAIRIPRRIEGFIGIVRDEEILGWRNADTILGDSKQLEYLRRYGGKEYETFLQHNYKSYYDSIVIIRHNLKSKATLAKRINLVEFSQRKIIKTEKDIWRYPADDVVSFKNNKGQLVMAVRRCEGNDINAYILKFDTNGELICPEKMTIVTPKKFEDLPTTKDRRVFLRKEKGEIHLWAFDEDGTLYSSKYKIK